MKFYLHGDEKALSDEEASKVSREPDWLCSFCGNLNPSTSYDCRCCGGKKTESEKNYFQTEKVEVKPLMDSIELSKNREEAQPKRVYERKPAFSLEKMKPMIKIGAGVLAAILLIVILVGIFTPKIQEVKVESFNWERSIDIEELRTFDESDWSLPAGARLSYTNTEIQRYDHVIDHYETKTRQVSEQVFDHYDTVVTGTRDLGNGYFEEVTSQVPVYRTEYHTETYDDPVYVDVPVYGTKYYYEIDRWVHNRYVKSYGVDKKPFWEEFTLADKEREGDRAEKYIVNVMEKDKKKEMTLDYDKWMLIEKGQTIKVKEVMGVIVGLADDKEAKTNEK